MGIIIILSNKNGSNRTRLSKPIPYEAHIYLSLARPDPYSIHWTPLIGPLYEKLIKTCFFFQKKLLQFLFYFDLNPLINKIYLILLKTNSIFTMEC